MDKDKFKGSRRHFLVLGAIATSAAISTSYMPEQKANAQPLSEEHSAQGVAFIKELNPTLSERLKLSLAESTGIQENAIFPFSINTSGGSQEFIIVPPLYDNKGDMIYDQRVFARDLTKKDLQWKQLNKLTETDPQTGLTNEKWARDFYLPRPKKLIKGVDSSGNPFKFDPNVRAEDILVFTYDADGKPVSASFQPSSPESYRFGFWSNYDRADGKFDIPLGGIENDAANKVASITPVEFESINPLPDGPVTEFARAVKESYEVKWNVDSTALELYAKGAETPVEGFSIDATDPQNPIYTHTYTLDNPFGEPEEVSFSDSMTDPKFFKVIKTENGAIIDLAGQQIIDGEFVREVIVSPNGEPLEHKLYSIDEVMVILQRETEKYVAKYGNGVLADNSDMRDESLDRMREIAGKYTQGRAGVIILSDTEWNIYIPQIGFKLWINSKIYIKNDQGNMTRVPIMSYIWTSFGQDGKYGLVAWQNADGEYVSIVVDYPQLNGGYDLNGFEYDNPFIIN